MSSFVGWSLLSATIKALTTLLGHQRGGPALPWWPARKNPNLYLSSLPLVLDSGEYRGIQQKPLLIADTSWLDVFVHCLIH